MNNITTIEESAVRLRSSERIAVVLPEELDMGMLASAFAFAGCMRDKGKSVSIFAAPQQGKIDEALKTWSLTHESEPAREFIISFDLSRSPIKELRYEREENRLDIILSPTESRIRREDIVFGTGPLRYDLVVTIGIPDLARAEASVAGVPELLHEKPILNIDSDPANKRYGELNLVPESNIESVSIPEIIWNLLERLGALPSRVETATALLAALSQSTKNFHLSFTGKESFAIAAELMRRGANPALLPRGFYSATVDETEVRQLSGRAMARSRFDERTETLWASLTHDDFLQTGAHEHSVPETLERLTRTLPYVKYAVLLWHDGTMVRIALACTKSSSRKNLQDRTNARAFGTALSIPDAYATFPDAEARAHELLALADAVE